LDASRFVRIHRSFILNVERLARIDLYGKDSWLAILSDGTKLPMSRTGHAKLKELIG
jgi:two-component system LytT family response regulator